MSGSNGKYKLRQRRSQTHSVDLIIAVSVFIITFLSVSAAWDHIRVNYAQTEARAELEILSRYAMESLLMTPGNPQNWHNLSQINNSNVIGIGLASPYPGEISEKKLNALLRLNSTSYNSSKELIGLRGPDYEYSLNITQYTSNFIYVNSAIVGYVGQCRDVVKIYRISKIEKGNYVAFEFRGCRKA